jgi:cell division protein FtsW
MAAELQNNPDKGGDVPSILSKRRILAGDGVLWAIVVLFFAISFVVVYSSTAKLGFAEGSTSDYLHKHFVTLCISGCIVLFIYNFIGAKIIRFFTVPAYVFALLLTLAAYFTGGERNDAARWINLGFMSFQPSELLKIGTIMLLSVQLSVKQHCIKRLHLLPSTWNVKKWFQKGRERDIILHEVIPVVLPIALACAVILPAHTSSAVHLFAISIAMLFIAGLRAREIGKLLCVAAIFGFMVMLFVGRFDTVMGRVRNYFNANSATNTEILDSDRSQMAIHNGGIFGVGAGRSVMRARLTHPESDYLFSIMVEEYGLLLSFFVVLLYLWLFFRSLRIFERSEWLYAGLLAVGLALLITSQAFLHIAVNLGILPETGQNLPFLTQGRTGMFCASIAMGIILSISRQVDEGTLVPPSSPHNPNKRL